ncbi:hypothetical protein GGS23DRAFT_619081 [Durotheca rogersii]|uniref:uncharacterized protein n=1 Tax=Durotheca rogersii TaxID=419775 RepID=UPI00221F97A4|nr:uncharacterized protein GGS23DRAFT_619081 [Durotheca rogersii]KAI5864495.1 hypothetical protein GGS23DRAFT_619081 [Durotheca rogersii]
MPADRLLATALRAYQDAPNPAETDKILATTTTLLTNLNNPLNLSLLTSHFLTARAIWQSPDGLRTCLRIMSIYNTAAIHVRKNELDNVNLSWGQTPTGSGVRSADWVHAIAKGTDDRSSRWQHVLVLTGILMGMEGDDKRSLSRSLRSTLENAVVTAANLALGDHVQTNILGRDAVVLALTYAFPLLSESVRLKVNGDALLPAAIGAMLGAEGFQEGDFIPPIARDVTRWQKLQWNPNSPSAVRLQRLESRPLAQNMGPLSRLASFAVQHAADTRIVLQAQDDLLAFTRALLEKWSRCQLSTVDLSVEAIVLAPDLVLGPYHIVWQLLKKIMYTVVAILQPVVGRCLLDIRMNNHVVAPTVASKTLHALRNLSFISTRQGAGSFQVYTFTYLTSLDIITRYPDACASFLEDTQPPPPQTSTVPSPVVQALTLFYLNTAEHLPLSLPTPVCERLIIAPASAFLSPTSSWLTSPANSPPSALTLELFEAAHSATLATLSCPQHSVVAAALVPFYVDTLLSAFPARITPRQFRLAFRTVLQIAAPPYPLSATHPELAETLLEMLRFRASAEGGASTQPLVHPQLLQAPAPGPEAEAAAATGGPVSEQTALVLALTDALPYLPAAALEEWLTRAAEAATGIADPRMRDAARRRLWEVLAGGEMDVERAAVGVAWWGTRGGREMVMLGRPRRDDFLMSGALAGREREEANGGRLRL